MEPSLLDEFVNESKEHLTNAEADFLQCERQGCVADAALINRIFRAVHTIKGSAGFLGLVRIGELAHRMETLMAMVRDGAMSLSPSSVGVLLDGVDRLGTMLSAVESSNEVVIADLLERLQAQMERDGDSQRIQSLQERVVVPFGGGGGEFSFAAYNLNSLPAPHRSHIYVLSYDLLAFQEKKGKSPVHLLEYLATMGTILDGALDTTRVEDLRDGLPSRPLIYRLLYGTVLDASLIPIAVELDEKDIEEIPTDAFEHAASSCEIASDIPPPPPPPSASRPEPSEVAAFVREGRDEPSVGSGNADTIRIRVDVLDRLMQLAGELVLVRNQQLMNVNRADTTSRAIAQRLDIVTSDLQETIMRTRMQPIGSVFARFSRMVRDLGLKLGKDIAIETQGNEVELDKSILEALADPLVHIVRNSCDHGIENPQVRAAAGKPRQGTLLLKAYHQSGQMIVEIRDDGRGIDAKAVREKALEKGLKSAEELAQMSVVEIQALIFLPGFSTAAKLSDVSGRGVGMDVVKTSIERLGGTIDLLSDPGQGTRMTLRLPLTLAIIPSLIVRSGTQRYAIPQINLEELVCLYDEDVARKVECAGSREVYRLRDALLPLVRLGHVLRNREPFCEETKDRITEEELALREAGNAQLLEDRRSGISVDLSLSFAVLKAGGMRFGLVIDDVVGFEEIVVKPMHRAVKHLPVYAGVTVLGDGEVAMILDVPGVARHASLSAEGQDESNQADTSVRSEERDRRGLFLFRSGPMEQLAVPMDAMRRIERVDMGRIETGAGREFVTIAGESVEVLRLEDHLPLSRTEAAESMFLLLPKTLGTPYGILASSLVDIGEYAVDLAVGTVCGDGIEGTAILRDHMTLLLRPEEIRRRSRPELFEGSFA